MPLGILDILQLAGFAVTPTTKFVRHQDPRRYRVDELVRRGWLELYQQYQGRPVFHGVDQFVSFYALAGARVARTMNRASCSITPTRIATGGRI